MTHSSVRAMANGLVPGRGFSYLAARWTLGMEAMTPRENDKADDRERHEAERRLEILRKEAHDEALERILLKDRKESSQ
jgi:hypothetical protein